MEESGSAWKTAPTIHSYTQVTPMIYAYNTPEVPKHDGWTKIGYVEKQTVAERLEQQSHTIDVECVLCWDEEAQYRDQDGSLTDQYFTDHNFHTYLETVPKVERKKGTEWFNISCADAYIQFTKFASREKYQDPDRCSYTLRAEQAAAVQKTQAYFAAGGTEFLWNAKPRFGKTLTAYDLVVRMGFQNVLVVTNRPAVANSWAEDFFKFISWQHEKLAFVSDNEGMQQLAGVLSRDDFMQAVQQEKYDGMIAFESLQGLKGSVYFGGTYDKLRWMTKEYRDEYGHTQKGMEFDLLIVDESHEGVDTRKTDQAFRNIARKHTLYLSGTPFRALADGRFNDNQIYNWSYADEQAAKANWQPTDEVENNPYETLPRLAMFTSRMSDMILDELQRGIQLSDDDTVSDYAFDLNEFFATDDGGKFVHEADVKKFLQALSTQEKYPFSTPELRGELRHTLWMLNRVASAKALVKLLQEDPVFSDYEIVLAAGDGKLDVDDQAANDSAYNRVKEAIRDHEKTITLSVGQLTVGVTIPEWSGVLMLCNMQSPASYMQAAFRAQNPCELTRDGVRYQKETSYVFDFDPARTLIIFDEFANNLNPATAGGKGTSEDRKENIRELLNFFPVIGEDDEGRMVELDAAQVLSIPRKIKSTEVVRHGFMSNFLFRNIGVVFGAPAVVTEILQKLVPSHEENWQANDNLKHAKDVKVDENGGVKVSDEIVIGQTQNLFGDKIYQDLDTALDPLLNTLADTATQTEQKPDKTEAVVQAAETMVKKMTDAVRDQVVEPAAADYGLKKSAQEKLSKEVAQEIESDFQTPLEDFKQQVNVAKTQLEQAQKESDTPEQLQKAENAFSTAVQDAVQNLVDTSKDLVQDIKKNKPQEVVKKLEKKKAEQEKRTVEDEVRAHLRGFCRTIPSFLMAYGDDGLNLANFDDYTEDEVFLEVTGISEEEFRFLRDGGDRENPETGEMEHFDGHIFDEVVFNDSVQEFLKKRRELANYFDENQTEDIFDYIPPQKTNQIFTPRWVVEKMVDELEQENPGCFDNPDYTFADLYMKSGLYITEIVKRLYRSEKMKALFPDDDVRVRHILEKQVYGMAPTRIIYLIATNYILGFDESLKEAAANFVEADAAEAARAGTLAQLVDEKFG